MAQTLAKVRPFLAAEAKRNADGNGIRPIERVPFKIVRPVQQLQYARFCPFCRKARGKIRKLGATSFQGTCPTCGATGPKRETSTFRYGIPSLLRIARFSSFQWFGFPKSLGVQ